MTETEPALDDGECVYFIGETNGVFGELSDLPGLPCPPSREKATMAERTARNSTSREKG